MALPTAACKRVGVRALGLSQAAFEHSVAYTKQRAQFGRPISTYQLTQYKLGRMATHPRRRPAADVRRGAAWSRDPGLGLEAAMAKLFASDGPSGSLRKANSYTVGGDTPKKRRFRVMWWTH